MLFVPPAPTSILSRSLGVDVADVFSTDAYSGTGATQSITNGIDLSTEGGMVWCKSRSSASTHHIQDTERGATKYLDSGSTSAEATDATSITSFNSDGFTLGSGYPNFSATTFVGWSFRKAPGFFDVVTYTGNGANRTISHNLGSKPGMVIVKRTDSTGVWALWHNSLSAGGTPGDPSKYHRLNDGTGGEQTDTTVWNDTEPTDAVFSIGTSSITNTNSATYIAYLFGHDADGIIQCGNYQGNGSTTGPVLSLGWQPQWVLIRRHDGGVGGSWYIYDSARDASNPNTTVLEADAATTESATGPDVDFNSTDFQIKSADNDVNNAFGYYIYMAIKAAA